MESSLADNIVETILEKATSNYVRKDEIREVFKNIAAETSLDRGISLSTNQYELYSL